MFHVHLRNDNQSISAEYNDQPLEFGRSAEVSGESGNGQGVANKIVVQDNYASRHHARLERTSPQSLVLSNLSARNPVVLADGQEIAPGEKKSFDLSIICFWIGRTWIEVEPMTTGQRFSTVAAPIGNLPKHALTVGFDEDETPSLEKITRWFETLISVQRAAAGADDFYQQAAVAAVNLIGFDEALVLSLEGDDWIVRGRGARSNGSEPTFSRSILREVVRERRTYYQPADELASLLTDNGLAAASPIFDADGKQVVGAVYGFRKITGGTTGICEISPVHAQLLQTLASVLSLGIARMEQQAEATRLRTKFDQFFTPRLAREIEKDASLLEGRERDITILVADLRSFSKMATGLSPRDTCHVITDVLECWSEAIRQNEGVIVDYAGDSILAIWNAPTDQPDHAKLAALSALRMLSDLPDVSHRWAERTGGALRVGVGVNTGPALVGNTGTQYKFKYGASGHAVNLASRVEAATKYLGVPILITDSTKHLIGDEFLTRRLPQIRVVGVNEPVSIYELHGDDPSGSWSQRRHVYEKSLDLFEREEWADACQTIQPLLSKQEDGTTDHPSILLAGRAIDCLKSPDKPFDPVITLDEK